MRIEITNGINIRMSHIEAVKITCVALYGFDPFNAKNRYTPITSMAIITGTIHARPSIQSNTKISMAATNGTRKVAARSGN